MVVRLSIALTFLAATLIAQSRVSLTDLGTEMYLGQFQGGLYENGLNVAPSDHALAGLAHATLIRPLDGNGNPSASGKVVMISVGMSNTTQEFCSTSNPAPCDSWSFVGQATRDASVNHSTLSLINGARGGQAADTWLTPASANYDNVRDRDLIPAGLTEAHVQVAWLKVANPGPAVSLPAENADAYRLVAQMGSILRAMKARYPNLRIVYISSRIYAGYATTSLNPEPYAYESGFAVKWIVQAQIEQMRSGRIDARAADLNSNGVAPWIAWGPYLWTDTWSRSDVEGDGTHPSQAGEQKVGALLLAFLKQEATARSWFLASPTGPRRRAVLVR